MAKEKSPAVDLQQALEKSLNFLETRRRQAVFSYEWEHEATLNVVVINKLASSHGMGHVFVVERLDDGSTELQIKHPSGERPVRFRKLSQEADAVSRQHNAEQEGSDPKVSRAIGHLGQWLSRVESMKPVENANNGYHSESAEQPLTDQEKDAILLDYAFHKKREKTKRERLSLELKEEAVPAIIKRNYGKDWATLEEVAKTVKKQNRKPKRYAEEFRRLSESDNK